MAVKKSDATQFEQNQEFQNLKVAVKKILAVPKSELVRREQEYQQTGKRHSRKKRTPPNS